jgi:hypothetical protein
MVRRIYSRSEHRFGGLLSMAQNGVTVFRDDSDPSVLGSARAEASVYLGASGDLRAETQTLDSFGISNKEIVPQLSFS